MFISHNCLTVYRSMHPSKGSRAAAFGKSQMEISYRTNISEAPQFMSGPIRVVKSSDPTSILYRRSKHRFKMAQVIGNFLDNGKVRGNTQRLEEVGSNGVLVQGDSRHSWTFGAQGRIRSLPQRTTEEQGHGRYGGAVVDGNVNVHWTAEKHVYCAHGWSDFAAPDLFTFVWPRTLRADIPPLPFFLRCLSVHWLPAFFFLSYTFFLALDMPQLAPTFSEVFDYQAYEENTVDESTVEVEKPDGPSFDVMDFPLDLPLDLPLHDVQNVASQDGALMQGPLRILHRLFHTDDQEIARTPSAVPLRRETTELMLDLSLPTAGPSRTASQQRLARELERMTSDFGSEFDGSDAVIYGGTERSEGSFSYQDCDEVEQSAHEDSCCSDVATQCDDFEDSLSDASQSEDEENVFDFEAQGSEDCDSDEVEGSEEDFASQSEEARSCDELSLAEDLPQDFPTPAPLEGVPSPSPSSLPSSFPSLFPSSSSFPSTSSSPPSSSLRRSSRVRRAAQPYVPPSSPKKDKGKGKAVAAEPRSPASSRRTIPKRGRSLSPVPEDTEDANAPSCSRPRKRARRSHSAVQALLAPLADGSTDVPCAVAGCDTVCSRNNLHALDNHFRDHYSSAERKRPAVRCRWGKCRTRGTFAELLRHLKKDHVEARFTCPDCGRSFSRIDPLTRHQRESCKKRPDAGAEKNGKGKRK